MMLASHTLSEPVSARIVCSIHHRNSSSVSPFHAKTGTPAAATAAVAWADGDGTGPSAALALVDPPLPPAEMLSTVLAAVAAIYAAPTSTASKLDAIGADDLMPVPPPYNPTIGTQNVQNRSGWDSPCFCDVHCLIIGHSHFIHVRSRCFHLCWRSALWEGA